MLLVGKKKKKPLTKNGFETKQYDIYVLMLIYLLQKYILL